MANTWIFQGNPEIFDVSAGVNLLKRLNWSVRQHKNEIEEGDQVYIWISGRNAGIVATATVTSSPSYYTDTPEETKLYPDGPPPEFQGSQLRVWLRIDNVLTRRITRFELLDHPVLSNLTILAMPRATNFRVSSQQGRELESIVQRRIGETIGA